MSFEAVPCMFRSTANDGNSSSYIGLLIRPSGSTTGAVISAPTNNPVSAAVVTGNTAPKSIHVVPAPLGNTSAPLTTTTPNFIVPATGLATSGPGVQLRIQPSVTPVPQQQQPMILKQHQQQHHHYQHQQQHHHHQQQQHHQTQIVQNGAPQKCGSSSSAEWLHTAPCSNISSGSSFDSPSPSQVVPQMQVGESYECQMPCTSNTSFFPPISSITQNLSATKSGIDLLQEMTRHVEMSSNVSDGKSLMNHNGYTLSQNMPSQHRPVHQSHFQQQCMGLNSMQGSYSGHIQMDTNASRMPSCQYHGGYNGATECSATPDSGIQSIGDSPLADPFTPPLPSPSRYPAPTLIDTKNRDETLMPSSPTDFLDMPRLIPFNEVDAESPLANEPQSATHPVDLLIHNSVEKSDSSVERKSDVDDAISNITISKSSNVNHLVDQIMSQMNPEELKQLASVIQSRVGIDSSSTNDAPPSDVNRNSSEKEEQLCIAETEKAAIQTDLPELTDVDSAMPQLEKTVFENWEGYEVMESGYIPRAPECSDERSVDPHPEPLMEQMASAVKDDIARVIVDESIYNRKRKIEKNCDSKISKKFSKSQNTAVLAPESFVNRSCSWFDSIAMTATNGDGTTGNQCHTVNEYSSYHIASNNEAEQIRKIEAEVREVAKDAEEWQRKLKEKCPEDNVHLQRTSVKIRLNESLKVVIEQIEKQFAKLELGMNQRMHFGLPWEKLDWEKISERVAKKNRIMTKKNKPAINIKSKKSRWRKLAAKQDDPCGASSSLSTLSSAGEKTQASPFGYIKIKQNAIVDAYQKVEGMQCPCFTGCCGDNDNCHNRLTLIECDNDCSRNSMCTNRRIYRREWVTQLTIFDTANGCGLGVKTNVDIVNRQFICEYVGEVVSIDTFNQRNTNDYRYRSHHFALSLCSGTVIDAYRKGNITRFVNHSCAPNCEMQRWTVNGQFRMGLFALRTIKAGEELTYDYNWDAFKFNAPTLCRCGTQNCRMFLEKQVAMTVRDAEHIRSSRVLLMRNVRRSFRHKLKHGLSRGLRSRGRSENKPSIDATESLEEIFREIFKKFTESELVSKKLYRKLQGIIEELKQSPSLKSSEALDMVEEKFGVLLNKKISENNLDRRKVHTWQMTYASIKRKYLRGCKTEVARNIGRKSRNGSQRVLTTTIDYSYLDSEVLVGSYDHDIFNPSDLPDQKTDRVRCICGIFGDNGMMVQCERCNFWLHADCIFDVIPEGEVQHYICEICMKNARRTPSYSISLRMEPDYNYKDGSYYQTLANSRGLQVRLEETVYVKSPENDDYKHLLQGLEPTNKRLKAKSSKDKKNQHMQQKKVKLICMESEYIQQNTETWHRKDVCCFRVLRLFSVGGNKFLFGCYYSRPHQVYCEPGRLFHQQELFLTNMYDTLPLDAVVGRCLILSPTAYSLGRPKMPFYKEPDVYFCEYQNTKGKFEKIASKVHFFNLKEDHFNYFANRLPLMRTFTPFIMKHCDTANSYSRCAKNTSTHSSVSDRRRKRMINLEMVLLAINCKKSTPIVSKFNSRKRVRLS